MNFQNLPADWPTIPLTNPDHIADVLDLFVGTGDRMRGSLLLLLCDAQHRPVQPLIINDVDSGPPSGEHLHLDRVAQQLSRAYPEATVLCAVARPGRTRVTKTDQRWARSLERVFAGRLQLLGVHLVTLDGSVPIPGSAQEAA